MTITNGYTTLAVIKGQDVLNFDGDTTSNAILERAIEAASREIDADCGRWFYKSATDETRYYTSQYADKLFTDDIVSVTELATDEDDDRTYSDVWSATADYDLVPYNAAAMGNPYTAIEIRSDGSYTFPPYRKGVKITGIFGFPAVPSKIEQACIMLTSRLFKRLSTPLGVAAMAEFGEVRLSIKDKDPDYWHLIAEFRKI